MENIIDRSTGEPKTVGSVHCESFRASEVELRLMLPSKLHEREYSILTARDIADIVESDPIAGRIR